MHCVNLCVKCCNGLVFLVDKKGRRPSEIEMMKKQLKKVPGSDSEDEKVITKVKYMLLTRSRWILV